MNAMLPRNDGDELIYHGQRVDFILRPIPLRSGGARKKEIVLHPGAVVILPVLDDRRIVMIRNHRPSVGEVLLELPAGTLERDENGVPEDPLGCAARELAEETGYRARKFEPLGWFYASPGVLTEKMWVFLATGLEPGPQNLDENEQIVVEPVEIDEALRFVRENRIVDAKTIATLLKYCIGPGEGPKIP
jgi:ADP-ribose pyrophosphatase